MGHRICIISAGAWGTAIAKIIADKKHSVTVWDFNPKVVSDINEKHANEVYLPGVTLPENITATGDVIEAATGADYMLIATPSIYMIDVVKKLIQVPNILEGQTLIGILTKGFIPTQSGPVLITKAVENYLPGFYMNNLVYISGPSHAEEVSRHKLTGLISASLNGKNSIRFRELLSSENVLVFSSFDVVGVQTCAAIKNVIAIAFGMLDALMEISDSIGDNTESLLLAAGLNEIQLIGTTLGATHPETFTSIAGVGDLDVTCRSRYGRNRRFGRDIVIKKILGNFKSIDDLIERIGEVGYLPEGVAACRSVNMLLRSHPLKVPICQMVYRILNRDAEPSAAMQEIMRTIVGLPVQPPDEYRF